MKKVILALIVMLTASMAQAHGPRGYGGYYGGSNVWVPLIVGGTVGYMVSQSQRQPVYVYQQPVYTQQPQVIQQPPVVSTVPPGYRYEYMLDGNCNCYRTVLVPN